MSKNTLRFYLKIIDALKSKITCILLVFIFVMPFCLSLFKLGNFFTLKGFVEKYPCPCFSVESFKNKSFQKEFEACWSHKLSWNILYTKLFNTIFYTVFDKSYSAEQKLIIGKEKYLYEFHYIEPLSKNLPLDTIKINKLIKDLKEIQDYYKNHNKVFILVITPSKAMLCNQYVPDRFNLKLTYNNQQKIYEEQLKLFEKNGINFVDIPSNFSKISKEYIVFTRGGTHWSEYGKYYAAKLIAVKISKLLTKDIGKIEIRKYRRDNAPIGEDIDLANLLNLLMVPDKFPCEHVELLANKKQSNLKIKLIGGSFCYGLLEMFNNSKIFSRLDFYFYLKPYKLSFVNSELKSETKVLPNGMESLMKNINSGDVILLEMNQALLYSGDYIHIPGYINAMKRYAFK